MWYVWHVARWRGGAGVDRGQACKGVAFVVGKMCGKSIAICTEKPKNRGTLSYSSMLGAACIFLHTYQDTFNTMLEACGKRGWSTSTGDGMILRLGGKDERH